MDKPLYCNVDSIWVDKGDHSVQLFRGQELIDVPEGTLTSMLNLKQAVDELPAVKSVIDPDEATPSDWRQTEIASLDINKNAKAAFAEAGLVTVADGIKYGTENEGLQSINGIGEASEKEFQAAVTAIQPKE
jgi:hypothetical protein